MGLWLEPVHVVGQGLRESESAEYDLPRVKNSMVHEIAGGNSVSKARQRVRIVSDPSGEGGGDRTHDPRIKSPLLYQLSYAPTKVDSLASFVPSQLSGGETIAFGEHAKRDARCSGSDPTRQELRAASATRPGRKSRSPKTPRVDNRIIARADTVTNGGGFHAPKLWPSRSRGSSPPVRQTQADGCRGVRCALRPRTPHEASRET